jgi:RNA polymerase sigma factor (TIGR02999 family)
MSRDRVTAVLAEAGSGSEPERQALDRLLPLVYDELRRMARAQLAREGRRLTLDTTGLVHEAYIKLVDVARVPVRSRAYFFAAAARAMRQVLIDAARRRKRDKRGGGEVPVTLEEATVGVDAMAEELLELDAALGRLEVGHPRPARVLECRYFGGLSVKEIGAALELAPRSVDRDLAFAKAWLRRELGGGSGAGPAGESPAP